MSATTQPLRCLIVEDVDDDAQLMLRHLRNGGFAVTWERVDTPEALRAALARQPWDVVLSDYRMPRFSGLAALKILRASGLDLPFIIISGTIGEELAVAAMKAGADDYLIKGELAHLTVAVERELRNAATRREHLRAEAAVHHREARYQALTESSHEAIITADLAGTITDWNSGATRNFGYTAAEAIGQPLALLVPQRSREAYAAWLTQLQAGGPLPDLGNDQDLFGRRKDGSEFPLELSFSRWEVPSGQFCTAIIRDITRRKRIEAERSRLDRDRQLALDAALLGWWQFNPVTRIFRYDDRCKEIYGLESPETTEERVRQIVDPRDEPRMWAAIVAALDPVDPKPYAVEFRIRHADGAMHWIEAHAIADFAGTGDARHAFSLGGTVTDITQRKQAEEARERDRQRLTVAQRIGRIGDWEYDLATQRVSWSPQVFEIFGRAPQLGPPRNLAEITAMYDAASRTLVEEKVARALATGEPQEYEVQATRPDGRRIFLSSRAVVRKDENGKIVGLHGTVQDITEQKAAEAAVRESESKYRRLVEGAPDIVYTFSSKRGGLYYSACVEAVLGYSVAHLQAHPFLWQESIEPADVEGIRRAIGKFIAGEPYDIEYQIKDARGNRHWLQDRSIGKRQVGDEIIIEGIATDITKRKQLEVEGLRRESMFRAIFDHAPVGISFTTSKGLMLVNAEHARITGVPVEESKVPGAFARASHPEDYARQMEASQKFHHGKVGHYTLEKRYVHRDGREQWAELTSRFYNDPITGERVVVTTLSDLTERKVAESTTLLQTTALTAAANAIVITDLAGTVVWANPAFSSLTGYTAEETLGRNPREVIGSGQHPHAFFQQMWETILAGRVWHGTLTNRRKDGSLYPEEMTITPVRATDGKITHFIAIKQDLTETLKTATRLRQSELRYRSIFDSNPVSVLLYDLQTLRFREANTAAQQQYGYTRDEFLGLKITDLYPEEDVRAVLLEIKRVNSEHPSVREWRHRRKDRTIIQVAVVSSPLVFEERPARIVIAADISERKLFEEKTLHIQRLESLGMLAAGIAHDLNNVLAPILFAPPMLRASHPSERDLQILNSLEKSAERGASLVKQILGFARTTSGEFQSIQVKHLCRDIVDIMEETFPKNITLEHLIPSDLWAVQGNPTQIHQVLLNLCVNARDAMPAGGTLRLVAANRTLTVAESAAAPGGLAGSWLELEVSDTGSGIPPKVLEHIWEPFFTTKDPGKGTGLGLSTVRGIMVNHHGFVEVHTAVGRGTTFRVFLPVAASDQARTATALPFPVPRGQEELILVADDDTLIRDLITQILEEQNYRVASCPNGQEALALFSATPGKFPLLITDIEMPLLGGLELIRAVLRIQPGIRLIGISGLATNKTGESDFAAVRALVHDFLTKPFSTDALLAVVHRTLHPAAGSSSGIV